MPAQKQNVYKKLELVGSSTDSIEDAIHNAIETASQSVNNLEWFEVVETRGHVESGKVVHFQVVLKVGFRVDN